MKPSTRARVRRLLPLLLLAAGTLIVAAIVAEDPVTDEPLSPTNVGPDGTKALVLVLRQLGADVEVSTELPTEDDDVALLLSDDLDDAGRGQLLRWVRAGGRLVATDPESELTAPVLGTTSFGLIEATIARGCDVPALASVARVSAPGSATYDRPPGATACFRRGGGSWLVIQPMGEGAVVSLGGPGFLTNGSLGFVDNAVLAAALLAPAEGTTVRFLQPPPPGGGDETLSDLVPEAVSTAFLQLLVAFGIVVLWRARRLGRPVAEPQPVAVPGSELVVAVGGLLQQTRAREHAAALMVGDLRRELCERLGLPPDVEVDVLADAAQVRADVPRDDVVRVLSVAEPPNEAALVSLAAEVEAVRRRLRTAGSLTEPTKES
jgi:hypothetical protein